MYHAIHLSDLAADHQDDLLLAMNEVNERGGEIVQVNHAIDGYEIASTVIIYTVTSSRSPAPGSR